MSSWDEWPQTGAGKQRVTISMPSELVLLAVGLYELSDDPTAGEKGADLHDGVGAASRVCRHRA